MVLCAKENNKYRILLYCIILIQTIIVRVGGTRRNQLFESAAMHIMFIHTQWHTCRAASYIVFVFVRRLTTLNILVPTCSYTFWFVGPKHLTLTAYLQHAFLWTFLNSLVLLPSLLYVLCGSLIIVQYLNCVLS